jgi:hypothetical protein
MDAKRWFSVGGFVAAAAMAVAVGVGCAGSSGDSVGSGSGAVSAGASGDPGDAGSPIPIKIGTYKRVASGDGGADPGTLTISSAPGDTLAFDIQAQKTIGSDEDPSLAGTHEGGANGTATAGNQDEYAFKGDDNCVLHFFVSSPSPGQTRISVSQDADTVCEPDPFVSLAGDYDYTPN